MQSPYEKRKKERVKTRVEVGVVSVPKDTEEAGRFRSTGVDVSVAGLAFMCDRSFEPGTELRVELPLPTTTINLNSTVVWSEPTADPEQWKVAVRFEALSNDCLRLLGWFVKEEGRKQLLDQSQQHPSSASYPAQSASSSRPSASGKPPHQTSPAARPTPTLATDTRVSKANPAKLEVKRLKRGQEDVVSAFLNRQPLRNVVMLGAISDYGLESAYHHGSFYGCFRQEELIGVALIGRHLVWSGSEESVAVFADLARRSHEPAPQMVLGDAETVEKFCRLLTKPGHATVRITQLQTLYTLTEIKGAVGGIRGLRLARTDEREKVAQLHARICREETGVDPLAQDPIGFRRRILARIDSGREWIWRDAHGIAFKADVAHETREAIYLEAVWVRPDLRGAGLGSTLLKSLCQRLLRHHQAVCIFADGNDERINAFYQKVGFEAMSPYRVARFAQ